MTTTKTEKRLKALETAADNGFVYPGWNMTGRGPRKGLRQMFSAQMLASMERDGLLSADAYMDSYDGRNRVRYMLTERGRAEVA